MNRLSGIRAVTFDVGGTLIDPWPSVGHIYGAVAREFGLAPSEPEILTAQFAAAWRAKVQFDYSPKAWAELVVRTFGGSPDQFGLGTAFFQRLYDKFTEVSVWHVYPDVRPALGLLRERGLRLGIISNWDLRLRPLLRNLSLDGLFHSIVVSAESGCQKPAPEIFRRAITELGVSADAALHVGDSRVEDLEGARGAGWQAALLRRGLPLQIGDELSSLSELVDRVCN
jgi:putative hydrolase of the HAD superfamily